MERNSRIEFKMLPYTVLKRSLWEEYYMGKGKSVKHKLAGIMYQNPGIDKKALDMKKSFDEVKGILDSAMKKKK